ncbi:flagellar basal body P-ring formation chaperone FlgA [Celeribacter persicus]|jgi:flagella basal body P-ring formation protein FlgA|uniref:Flagella basal body P-ring formation protein FlgA n=1 Tax=Celeribacter persicus TaxID=1651082 RepID=A0A2T5HU60_9RHOB|nr:flagellar basal body P-ring formation chaperone FlgA [Celeribacter persicus]PTQ75028.1 flagella basal body P-ring formation protein FlgA [Celeribacter persicus]
MIKPVLITACLWLTATPALADTVAAARTIRAQTILAPTDLTMIAGDVPGAINSLDEAVGLEARVMLYTGRPISTSDIGPAAIVERNQIVVLRYSHGGLSISVDGRALDRAGAGDVVRVMNLSSKTTVSGVVAPDGSIQVGGLAAQ